MGAGGKLLLPAVVLIGTAAAGAALETAAAGMVLLSLELHSDFSA